MRNVLNKNSVRTPVKHRKTAVYRRNRTVASQDFVSTAFLRYGAYPYSAVFCTAVAVYGTVVSPTGIWCTHTWEDLDVHTPRGYTWVKHMKIRIQGHQETPKIP